MPQINLSSLSGAELRQRLDASRARGDATLAYEILREMEARRAAEAGRRRSKAGRGAGRRRAGEPRIVDVDLGDPLDKGDDLPPMPHWRAPDLAAAKAAARAAEPVEEPVGAAEPAEVTPPRFRTLEAPLALVEPEPAPRAAEPEIEDLRMAAEPHAAARPPRRPRAGSGHGLRIAAGFAVGITSGVALGWFAADLARESPPPAQMAVAALAAAPPAARVEPAPEPAASALPTEMAEAPAAADAAAPAATVELELPAAEPSPPVETAAVADPGPLAANGCAAEPTPADREICADPELQRLQQSLRRAYAEALDAHEDRALLRQRQLAWREARSDVTDPVRLARLYEQRIRRLDAAAAQARSLR